MPRASSCSRVMAFSMTDARTRAIGLSGGTGAQDHQASLAAVAALK